MNSSPLHPRRDALKLILAGASAPLVLPSRILGQDAPSKKITIGCIGLGMQGILANLPSFLGQDDCRVIAVCDVDQRALDKGVAMVNERYGNQDCKAFRDFRELIARDDIDAVAISTPDHWHSIIAMTAALAGKDIFCEKPLSRTLNEGIAMVRTVQAKERVWQTGSWQRSNARFRWAAQLVQNGYAGKIRRVEVGLPSGHFDFGRTGNDKLDGPVPEGVDYDLWCGPRPVIPFNICRFHRNWRWNYHFGGGQLIDWIGHHCDIAHWGLANSESGVGPDDRIGPLELTATADFPPKEAVWNTATKYRVECVYPGGVEFVIAGGHADIQPGAKWIGADGWVHVDRDVFKASETEWLRDIQERDKKGDLKVPLNKSENHFRNFLDCVKSRQRTITPIETAHRSQTPGHLGYIASVTGRKIVWNPETQQIADDAEASAMMGEEMRAPWKLPG
ncbi:MAG: Gfo/Idh/MocA family oxidoreductase [Verrucomicrobia bacterium]|nr:Gfo/Idh/MocA family oxidoreductase [Verrucomicrobiota bacterium]